MPNITQNSSCIKCASFIPLEFLMDMVIINVIEVEV